MSNGCAGPHTQHREAHLGRNQLGEAARAHSVRARQHHPVVSSPNHLANIRTSRHHASAVTEQPIAVPLNWQLDAASCSTIDSAPSQ